MKAVAYCRVSSEEQFLEVFSLDTQKKEIEDYGSDNDIQLLQVYIDAGVIAISDDRMFRNLEDSIVVNNFATKNNVKIIYTRQLHYDTMDPFSSFIVKNVSSMMNQGYSLEYSLKVKKGLIKKSKKENGMVNLLMVMTLLILIYKLMRLKQML